MKSKLMYYKTSAMQLNIALLFLRLAVGISMIGVHGIKKFIHFKEEVVNIPDPFHIGGLASAILAGFADSFCVLLVMLGLFTRIATLPVLFVTLTGLFIVHANDSLLVKDVPYMYSVAFLSIFLLGPGKYSLDFLWNKDIKENTSTNTKNVTMKILAVCLVFMQTLLTQSFAQNSKQNASIVIFNANVKTMDSANPSASAIAVQGGKIIAVGNDMSVLKYANKNTQLIDANQRTIIPGLNDDHLHVIRGGRFYNLELRWDGVTSLKQALTMLKEQAYRTPDGQWIRVVGGWNEYQFTEKRLPTLEEINEAVPNKPVFILYLYGKAFVNKAGLQALKIDENTSNPIGGLIDKDENGHPTGLLVAEPNAYILYSSIGKMPFLNKEETINSTQQFLHELNRFGLTSANDAGGGGQNFPDDYGIVELLANENNLTVRIPYFLFAQKPGNELLDYQKWVGMLDHNHQNEHLVENGYKHEGGGENLLWSAADYENFLLPRPELPQTMEPQLKEVLIVLIKNKWPFRLHATYNESITRFLDLFEELNKEMPFNGVRWFFDHAETVSEDNLKRIKVLGGGIALQNRMAMQGELFVKRYGKQAVENTPPIRKILNLKIPTALGTDATRVNTYNPWLSIAWAVSGKTNGGSQIYPTTNRVSREEALYLYTVGSAWFSNEEMVKGKIKEGYYADLAILSDDYFKVPEDKIKQIESVLTIVNGKIVYGADEFSNLFKYDLKAIPNWSPVNYYNGFGGAKKH